VPFLSQLLRIVIIDLALSGDNAIVIGMAAHRLPPRQRRVAILIGGGAAIVLRISLTAIAAYLLRLQGLELAGGALLLWIGAKLLKQEEESHEGIAISTILVADFIMSLDNVLGVAGASAGNAGLLVFGLVFSMVILMFMGSLVADLINKAWWLAYVGAAVIAWTGADMMFEDSFVRSRVLVEGTALYAICGAITAGTILFAHWFHRKQS
jgi:YjbE family integral membrane protein